jgi:DNA replication protein DnaC
MNHMRNIQNGGDIAASIAQSFEKLIENAPCEKEGVIPDANCRRPSLVRSSNGWDARYVAEIVLTGEAWCRVFEEAKLRVADSGIVAFLGNRGPGKTRMAAEIARAGYWPNDKGEWNGNAMVYGKTALYRRAMDVFLELRDCGKKGASRSEKDVLEALSSAGLLVIDEFQERGESDWENRIICNLLDKRYATNRPTILIANYTPAEMKSALSPSVKDRMRESGKAFVFDWPSFRRRS